MIFKIRPKKKQACLVSRIAPQKNIVDFMKIAGSLPNIPFILVGTHSELEPDYARKVMTMKPNNVSYFDVRIRDTPGLVEESKVYLYTSREPGIGIALGQAMGAGCIPVTPIWGGGAEMVARTGTGYTFRSIAEAAVLVRNCIEQEQIRDDPSIIAKHARIFSSSEFENQISHLLGTAKT
jgi:glycosyltransferase involved in cell wall biosynthesis